MTSVNATLRYLQIAPRKVRLVACMIRGMEVKMAKLQLARSTKRAAGAVGKLLDSAVANAKHNFQIGEKNLYISQIRVNGGPMLKRMFPRARGRANLKRKRMSHLTLTLEEKPSKKLTS